MTTYLTTIGTRIFKWSKTNFISSRCSSVDRARGLGPRGRGFEPRHLDQNHRFQIENGGFLTLIIFFFVYCIPLFESSLTLNYLRQLCFFKSNSIKYRTLFSRTLLESLPSLTAFARILLYLGLPSVSQQLPALTISTGSTVS